VFVAAGALVTPGKRLRSGYLYRGSPAQEARPLSQQEREQLLYSAQHYVRLKNRHLKSVI
jgi:carbonic anhydrase/acetyltransferase-like protein (isoleucine patch superfamily)